MTNQGFEPPPMWQPLGYAHPAMDSVHKKWQTGSVIFGVVAMVIGGCSGCLGLLAPLALIVPQPRQASMPSHTAGFIISGAMLYLVVAGALIWLGIGAIKMRRWVRPLVLAVGLPGLLVGIYTIISMVILSPTIERIALNQPGGPRAAAPAAMMPIVLGITIIFMTFLFVALPAAFIWFYRKREVKEAMEYFDPVQRWTEKCPIPVLILVMILTLYAGSLLLALPQGILPVFGTVFHGLAAVVIDLIFAGMGATVAWQAYQSRPAGWWGAVAFFVLVTTAYLMTSLKTDQANMYQGLGYNEQQLEAIREIQSAHPVIAMVLRLPLLVLVIGYLIYVKKYFVGRGDAGEEVTVTSPL